MSLNFLLRNQISECAVLSRLLMRDLRANMILAIRWRHNEISDGIRRRLSAADDRLGVKRKSPSGDQSLYNILLVCYR